jgi:phosphoribosylaminoimidazolecarboxamide formyltransferase/IMP cyclohydrolase
MQIRRALLSVANKEGLVEFAQALVEQGIELIATGGTLALLKAQQLPVRSVTELTGFPEIMDGRVKTLHPNIHAAVLARRGQDDSVLTEHNIDPIDLLVVNLYPFAATIADPSCTLEQAIENIDIGGPAMIRAAAKNHRFVGVLVDPTDYPKVGTELAQGQLTTTTAFRLATKAFAHCAQYDSVISHYLAGLATDQQQPFPPLLNSQWLRQRSLRYGENPHQQAAFYRPQQLIAGTLASAQQLQGKPLSYNNITDGDAALSCVKAFAEPACVIVKHANPCGVATADHPVKAYRRAYATDPTSAFGGIIAVNRPLTAELAQAIIDNQFVEVIIAPEVLTESMGILASKKNVRVLACGDWTTGPDKLLEHELKSVAGGLLVQQADLAMITPEDLQVVTHQAPDQQQRADLIFAWQVVKFVKSNAIVYAKEGRTLAIGAGQMSRVYSAKIAALKAADEGLVLTGSVLASDAFFPFADGVETAVAAGAKAIIQPGGAKRDQQVIDAANQAGIAMVFTGMRHFRH